jgi:uncharacterized protein
MRITFDPAKRDWTLANRGLAFEDAATVLLGASFEFVDDRVDYGETRITTVGLLAERMVVVVWTQRSECCHVMSMRKANAREYKRYAGQLD